MAMIYEGGFVAETDPLSEDRQLIDLLDRGETETASQRFAEIAGRERAQGVLEILSAGADDAE